MHTLAGGGRSQPCRRCRLTTRRAAARDLLVGDSLWSNLASVALGLAVMIFFRLAGMPLLGALPSG